MKKLILGIILLTVLVVVAYYQTVRESNRRATSYRKGYHAGADSVQVAQPDFDSLTGLLARERQALADYQAEMVDSLSALDSLWGRVEDSLGRVISKQSADINRLRQQASAKKSPTKTQQAVKPAGTSTPSHQEILSYYKKAMSKLPSDLSDYEYRVSVDEIRSETAAKFSITLERLNQIRDDNHVDF
jgi:hypothetical protein